MGGTLLLSERQLRDSAEYMRLTARVAELERRLGRNSGNSSIPPSTDTFGRPVKKAAPSSGRRRGRQPGAPGGGLSMVADPDRTEDHLPAACSGCGSELGERDKVGFERRQVRDIPLVTVVVTGRIGAAVPAGCSPPSRCPPRWPARRPPTA
ncbi:DUF6444 domain-containing protein [Streptomyces sp. NPDC054884]